MLNISRHVDRNSGLGMLQILFFGSNRSVV